MDLNHTVKPHIDEVSTTANIDTKTLLLKVRTSIILSPTTMPTTTRTTTTTRLITTSQIVSSYTTTSETIDNMSTMNIDNELKSTLSHDIDNNESTVNDGIDGSKMENDLAINNVDYTDGTTSPNSVTHQKLIVTSTTSANNYSTDNISNIIADTIKNVTHIKHKCDLYSNDSIYDMDSRCGVNLAPQMSTTHSPDLEKIIILRLDYLRSMLLIYTTFTNC